MDVASILVLLLIAGIISIGFMIFIGGLFLIISFLFRMSLAKPAYRTRVKIAMQSCPSSMYGKRFLLTGSAKQYMMNVGTIIGFSRMHNEHLANLMEKKPKEIEDYLVSKTKEGVRLPPKEFWLDLLKHDKEYLKDLLFLNYVVVIPKLFSFLVWVPPLMKFLPKNLIIFLDSQLASPNKELFGDIWVYGVNLNMVHADYWFVDTERLVRNVLAMVIRSDTYVYELVESYYNLSEVAKNIAKSSKDLIDQMAKKQTVVGVTNLGQGQVPDERSRT